jgi:arylsulfatase
VAFASLTYTYVEAPDPVPEGTHQVRMEFAYDGGGLAEGAGITLYVDGNQVAEGRLEHTIPVGFSADETTDVGKDTGSRVVPGYEHGSHFTGTVSWVAIETGDDHNHLITDEQQLAFHVAQH